jgi:hypothetical protein
MGSFQKVMDLWPSRGAFRADIGATPGTVTNMYARDSVPPKYWTDMVLGAQERGIEGVTLARLASIAASKRKAGVAA